MLPTLFFAALCVALGSVTPVASLGTTCTKPLGSGNAAPGDPFWMQNIKHQGIAAFNPDPKTYQVFRNVKDFGAKGDGVTDDTAAINSAIAFGNRCQGGSDVCNSTTITPALVFFPQGTYLVSDSIVSLYYTVIAGDATNLPTILAASNHTTNAVIDADFAGYYVNQNNFFHSVRNLVLDLTQIPAGLQATGIHWQVSQTTSLMNIVINLSTAAGTQHQGIYMENGSGGFLGDVIINGGEFSQFMKMQGLKIVDRAIWHAITLTRFRFTVRNVTVNNAQIAVSAFWNWGWTFQGVNINNCGAIIDATVTNTPIFVRMGEASDGELLGAGSLVLNNINLSNVSTAIGVVDGTVVLAGGSGKMTIASWGQGNIYKGSNGNGTYTQGAIAAPPKPAVLLDDSGKIFGKGHPQYATYAVSDFVSVRDHGAKGDGKTDDTLALQAVFDAYAGCKIIFVDAGTYVVTSTLRIPAGAQVVGEAWSVIAGKGPVFQDQSNPQVVVQVGAPGSIGIMEITDIIFNTMGPVLCKQLPGAIVVEWNVKHTPAGVTGMWDSHIRLGGAAGTNLESNCPTDGSGGIDNCYAAFLGLHLTASSTAYLEGTWVWLADHDLDGTGNPMITLYSGRGILSESAGPVWMIGTAAEHHVIYQYNLQGAKNHYMGLIQTETPYFQPTPVAPSPFRVNSAFKDPSFDGVSSAWALNVAGSSNILVFGAGLYSFYSNYDQTCLTPVNCQDQIVNIDSTSSVYIYSLQTIGTTWQLSIDETGVVNQANNSNGFAQTVTSWTKGESTLEFWNQVENGVKWVLEWLY
ncbi:Exo-beta-1,3-glucanase [Mycena sanguinolenta]|uniref:Exo-beta-1,3-glucanase n=1 Tax=Mycena sanguinolenta TaxID=230812 RepID=A0A8H6YK06_9AGAR|nr:Exo-beta-1,3-glucanase [Mycena sanguinolenta]